MPNTFQTNCRNLLTHFFGGRFILLLFIICLFFFRFSFPFRSSLSFLGIGLLLIFFSLFIFLLLFSINNRVPFAVPGLKLNYNICWQLCVLIHSLIWSNISITSFLVVWIAETNDFWPHLAGTANNVRVYNS